jgi:hypothetical protein
MSFGELKKTFNNVILDFDVIKSANILFFC